MKIVILLGLIGIAHFSMQAQSGNPNTLSVKVNDVLYETEPRRIKIGHYGYITGNAISPDKSLRFWLASIDGQDMWETGSYLIFGERDNYKKDDAFMQEWNTGQYKGIIAIKYVEETKSPRMEYHVGESHFTGESVEATVDEEGYLEMTFNATLEGSWWKEKAGATAFGGIGRIVNKMEDKAVTSATGYDQNIDPEGAGYKKQKELDKIVLTEGKVRLKINRE